jgi:uncharacterized protein
VIVGTLASIWRFPIKSARGESLPEAAIETDGLRGDRTSAYVVVSPGDARSGKTFRGKENDRLHLVDDDAAARALAARREIELERHDDSRFFDDAPVSLLLDRWLEGLSAHLGYAVEPVRFRPNLFVRAASDFRDGEAALAGRTLALGSAVLRARYPIERCVVTTYDPAGGPSDPRILRYIAQERNTWMGVYCDVLEAGTVRVGDTLTSG